MLEEPKIIAVHGGPGLSSEYLTPLEEQFSNRYNFIKYTQGEYLDITSLNDLSTELEGIIGSDDSNTILFAHSFGSIIALNHFRMYQPKKIKYIFNSWVYDASWSEMFYKKNFQLISSCKSTTFKETMYYYGSLYFEDSSLAKNVFDKLKFNEEISKIQQELNELNFKEELKLISDRTVSISSSDEEIVPFNYIQDICSKCNIKNYFIQSKSHFSFLEKPEEFNKIFSNILKELLC